MIRVASLLLGCLLATVAMAEERGLVAVLPLDTTNAKMDAPSTLALEETLRTAAGDALVPKGYTVLTGETTIRILQENGVDAQKACESSCALEAAKEMKADLFISGTVATSEGEHLAFVRLFASKSGKQLASVKLEGKSVKEIRKAFDAKADDFFAKGLAALGVSSAPAKETPPPTRDAAGEVLVDLDLKKNLGGMTPVKDATADCRRTPEGFRCTTNYQGGYFGWREPLITLNDNYEIELAVKNLQPETDGGPVILFGHSGGKMAGCSHTFVPSEGKVWCNYTDGKIWADTLSPRPFAAIKRGALNVFKVRVTGRRVRVWVNGEQLGVYDSPIPLDGAIRLSFGGKTDVLFERVTIREVK
jgi:hypothetical protein